MWTLASAVPERADWDLPTFLGVVRAQPEFFVVALPPPLLARNAMGSGRLPKAWAGLCHRAAIPMAAANVINAIEAGHFALRDLRGEHRHDGSKPTQPTKNKGWSLKCRFVVG